MQFVSKNAPHMQSFIKRVVALGVTVVVTAGSVVTVAAATCNADIEYDGDKMSVQLLSNSTQDILHTANIKVDANDLVERTEGESGGDVKLVVKSGYSAIVTADGKRTAVVVHYGDTVADALDKAAVTPGENDLVNPGENTQATENMNISVKRMYDVTVLADGKSNTVQATQGSVAEALESAGVTVGGEDVVSPSKDATVTQGMKISVSRVTYDQVTATEPVAYTETTEKDSSLYQGEKEIKTAGVNGVRTVVSRQKLVDGKTDSSEVVSNTVTTQPVNQVTRVGTKKKPAAVAKIGADGTVVDHNGKTISYKKVISGRCTAYSGGGYTATGRSAAVGLVAVNPNLIPYGTKLYIASADGRTVYGYATAADTGSAAMTGRILADLYYASDSQCVNFGVRKMNIYVL